MPKVPPELVDLLQALFDQGELSRALEREDWSAALMKHLSPVEYATPDAWSHGVVRLAVQRGQVPELLAVVRRLRPNRAAEIDAVERTLKPMSRATPVKVATPSVKVTPVAVANPARWRPVRVLHLSDLHFSAKTAWDSGTVLGRLVADVARLRDEVGDIHLVVVTGDIANLGTAEEYERATAWLTGALAAAAGVNASKIRVVPGNHDVHRGSITRTAKALTNDLLGDPNPQQAIAEVLGSEKERASLLERQSAYLTFAQTFHPGLTVPWWSESLPDLEGLTVHLAGLNSAWLSASDADRGNLVLSRWLCNQLFAGAERADLTIALMHHPWDYLHELDRESEEAIRRRCGVILHGHLHDQKARLTSDPDRDVLQLAAGASYAGAKWANAYQLLELDPMLGEARVHFRLWDGFDWIPDRNRYQKAPNGIATLPLRRSPNAPMPPPEDDPADVITDDPTPVRTDRQHYTALLKGQLNKLPDVFRVCGGPSSVEAVFVEVTLATSEHAPEEGAPDAPYAQSRGATRRLSASVKDLRGRVPLSRVLAHAHRRWGLLGDPGSGKTTLLRHVAVELLNQPDGPLPIYLKVAELTHGLKKAITALCASFNTPNLAAFVLAEARVGRAVLLIDGLDEATDPHAASKWVCGAAAEVGESQVVVASRPIGYTEPSADFRTLTLCPLGAAEQAELLTRWVDDRDKARVALERLSRTPRLRRLAENPLLLTLVGLVLRAGQDVPRRRGELYERALKLLLTRGHDADGVQSVRPMRKPTLTVELLSGAALRLHGQEGEVYRRAALIASLKADPHNVKRLHKNWFSPKRFIAEVAERTGLLIPDTGRVKDASAYSFPHRTFRELLAATALERDVKAGESGAGELSRVLAEGKAHPERWAEVLALTCGRLGPGGADALVRRVTAEGSTALLLRVVADAEGISEDAVRSALELRPGAHAQDRLWRQKVIQEIPAAVNDLHVAVGLLEQVAKSSTCGHDLYWVRETLTEIARGAVSGPTAEGTEEDARRAARGAAQSLLRSRPTHRRAAALELLQPWWRDIPGAAPGLQVLAVPVTWAMYRLFDPAHDAARCTFDGALPVEAQRDVPVYNVTWCAAAVFAEWVGARLPREDEWELACRGGETTRFWSGDTDDDLHRVAWCASNSGGHPHPVALKPSNPWGLHDVHGNVMEWCDEAPQDAQCVMSASPAEVRSLRGLRGGAWSSEPELAEVSHRLWEDPNSAFWDVGFRLVRMVSPGEVDSGAG